MKAFKYYQNDTGKIQCDHFLQIPFSLLKNTNLDSDCILIYSLLLDRTRLSLQNSDQYSDEYGRVFVIYSASSIMELVSISKNSYTRKMQALESAGMILRKRRGRGLSDVIYVADIEDLQNETSECLNHQEDQYDVAEDCSEIKNPQNWDSKNHVLQDCLPEFEYTNPNLHPKKETSPQDFDPSRIFTNLICFKPEKMPEIKNPQNWDSKIPKVGILKSSKLGVNQNNINNNIYNKITDKNQIDDLIIQAIKLWNSINTEKIGKVYKIQKKSYQYQQLAELFSKYSIEQFEKMIQEINTCPFLQGCNTTGWSVSFNWILNPENFLKVLRGNYRTRSDPERIKNKFLNHPQREYNFDSLERQLLQQQLKKSEYLRL